MPKSTPGGIKRPVLLASLLPAADMNEGSPPHSFALGPAPPDLHPRPPSHAGAPSAAPLSVPVRDAALRLRAQKDVSTVSPSDREAVELLRRELAHFDQRVRRAESTVEGVWESLELSGSLPALGQAVYARLLVRDSKYRALFRNTRLEEQPDVLLRMVGSMVAFTGNQPLLVELGQRLGARHRRYGVPETAFQHMHEVFMESLAELVTPTVYAAAKPQWEAFWAMLMAQMLNGYNSASGALEAAAFDSSQVATLQKHMKKIATRQDRCVGRDQFIGVMYCRAIEKDPTLALKFSALLNLRAANRVFASIKHICVHFHEKDGELQSYMMELGARHTAYNVSERELHQFEEPFIFACRRFLPHEMTDEIESILTNFFSFMVNGILEGMASGKTTGINMYAPSGSDPFCLLFTDIENSTKLWQLNGSAMGEAVKQHHRLIRILIAEYGAYEVKTVGDSFIIACKDMLIGVKLALAIQLDLMRAAPIAEGFRMTEGCEGGGDPECWDERTLRVRVGIEYCTEATPTYDPIHRRYDYYGTSVNRCARIEAAACGGQILMSRQTLEALMAVPEFHNEACPGIFRSVEIPSPSKRLDDRGLDHFVSLHDMGLASLKGLSRPVHLVSMVPSCLSGRRFSKK